MAEDKLYEIQSIIDGSKETLSSDLYNKLSLACKKSFEEKEKEKHIFVKVKIMYFFGRSVNDDNVILPKFRFDIIPVKPYQLRILKKRNLTHEFTLFRSITCVHERTEICFAEKLFCNECDDDSTKSVYVYTGEYIVHTYDSVGNTDWLSHSGHEYKHKSEPLHMPQDEE